MREFAQLAVGFARAAQAHGVEVLPKTPVTRVLIEDGEVTGVDTTRGRMRAPVVVDAAGAWTRQVAEASGIRVPLIPDSAAIVRHRAGARCPSRIADGPDHGRCRLYAAL